MLVVLLYATVPGTAVPELVASVNAILPDCTDSLKVAVGADETVTPVTPEPGVWELTLGCVGSVVKPQVKGVDIASPELFSAPLIVAVYDVPYAREVLGVNVAVFVVVLYETVAGNSSPSRVFQRERHGAGLNRFAER